MGEFPSSLFFEESQQHLFRDMRALEGLGQSGQKESSQSHIKKISSFIAI